MVFQSAVHVKKELKVLDEWLNLSVSIKLVPS